MLNRVKFTGSPEQLVSVSIEKLAVGGSVIWTVIKAVSGPHMLLSIIITTYVPTPG